tara:strand:- start:167 stop:901 length:735 start_codon:yes stop_codon:yes gene_type:complete
MSHYQQVEFCKLFKNEFFESKKISILELGSYDVNGSIRTIFDNTSKYVGLDLIKGPGVDIVYDGKNIPINQEFDLCISCECFEHNPNYFENFIKMIELAKQDGLVVFTCASIGRREHGTTDSNFRSSPGSMKKWNYYKNLKKSHFTKRINLEKLFYKFLFFENYVSKDLYFIGIKSKKYEKNLLNFRSKIIRKNTLVLDLNLTLREIIARKTRFFFKNILPSIIGDFLTRKIRIKIKKIMKIKV